MCVCAQSWLVCRAKLKEGELIRYNTSRLITHTTICLISLYQTDIRTYFIVRTLLDLNGTSILSIHINIYYPLRQWQIATNSPLQHFAPYMRPYPMLQHLFLTWSDWIVSVLFSHNPICQSVNIFNKYYTGIYILFNNILLSTLCSSIVGVDLRSQL